MSVRPTLTFLGLSLRNREANEFLTFDYISNYKNAFLEIVSEEIKDVNNFKVYTKKCLYLSYTQKKVTASWRRFENIALF